jgi:oligosaccharide repeat unit polymerase
VKAEKAVAGFYFLRQFAVVGVLLSIFTLYYLSYLARVRQVALPWWWTWAVLACFIVNAFGIYAWGQRYSVAMACVGMVAGYHYFVARLSLVRLSILGTVFLVVFLGLRLVRDTLLFPEGVISLLEGANIWRQIAIAMHGSQFDALLLVLRDFDLTAGLRWGEDFAAGLAALFPRAIWPDSPASSLGAWFRQVYEPETINGWPITMLGEWLVNFGWAGVLLGGVTSGYVLRAARDAYQADAEAEFRINPPVLPGCR